MAARSDRPWASAFQPTSAGEWVESSKWTPSTTVSMLVTDSAPARTTAASSPTQRTTRSPRRARVASIASISSNSRKGYSLTRAVGAGAGAHAPRAGGRSGRRHRVDGPQAPGGPRGPAVGPRRAHLRLARAVRPAPVEQAARLPLALLSGLARPLRRRAGALLLLPVRDLA